MSQNGPVSMIMTSTMEQVISQAVTSNGTNNEQAPTSSHEQSLTHPTEAEASSNPSAQHSAAETPVRRGPGRPKGSGKKGRDPIAILEGRRPVGRPRKDGLPAGSFLPTKERKSAGRPRKSAPGAIGTNTMQSSTGQFRHAPYERNAPNSVQNFFSTPPQANGPAPWQAVYSSLGGGGKQSVVPPMASLQGDLVNPLDPELEKADWSSIVHSKPNSFMRVLLASLTSSSLLPVSGLSVEDAFRSHLVSLTPKDGDLGSIPSLYSIMKTFWLPSSPAYFSLTASASTTRIPSEHRFLYWDPQPLVFNGISCPTCSAPLTNRGRIGSGPIKIYDLGKPFYIIGCEYHCTSASCTHNGTTEGRKFASTDTRILRSLPDALRNEFPARLLQGDQGVGGDLGSGSHVWNWQALGVSVALYKMVKECLKAGLARDAILGVIHGVQYGAPDDVWNREEEEEDAEHDEEQPQDKTVANHISVNIPFPSITVYSN
ncbi:hypothetical protein BD410DRAFT_793840 [Rickenella mellea]|uniref:Uncharacterized protein n=1 Tax=Rickenella mellea TaxID=50990 RepID=A0A4Y7PRF7_9AGAM|nr:hypothetical protein BD410DRAFT_793840 [Rickenella mellea]